MIGFVAVAENGSVHGAARRLNISQAALTRRLQRLEAEIGTPLFIRSGRRLSLSPAGEKLLVQVRPHVDALAAAIREVKDYGRSGQATVNFGCLPSISRLFLPTLVSEFLLQRPDTRVRVFDSSANEVIAHVIGRSADFGVSLLGMVPAGLTQDVLGDDPLVLLVHRRHRFSNRSSVTWRDLVNEPLIAGGGPSGNRSLMESVKAHIGVDLDWRHEVQHIPTAIEWTAAGIAHTITPRLTLGDGLPSHLHAVEIGEPQIARRLGILYRSGERLSAPAEALRRSIATALRRKLTQQKSGASPSSADTILVRLGESSAFR